MKDLWSDKKNFFYQSNKANFNSEKNNIKKRKNSCLQSGHDQKRGRQPGEVTDLHLDRHLLSTSAASKFYVCFRGAGKTKTNLFTNTSAAWLRARGFLLLLFFYARPSARSWACSGVLRVRSEDVTPWSFITRGDTLSPALRDAQAMFYKRITRQAAPAGHPLPPCATPHTCTHARTARWRTWGIHRASCLPLRSLSRPSFISVGSFSFSVFFFSWPFKIPFIHSGFCTVLQRLSEMERVCTWHTHTHISGPLPLHCPPIEFQTIRMVLIQRLKTTQKVNIWVINRLIVIIINNWLVRLFLFCMRCAWDSLLDPAARIFSKYFFIAYF